MNSTKSKMKPANNVFDSLTSAFIWLGFVIVLAAVASFLPAWNASRITVREVEVLKFVAQGLPNQEIAEKLSLSERTVRTHVGNILNKLHLANRTQAALYAVREGLAKLDP